MLLSRLHSISEDLQQPPIKSPSPTPARPARPANRQIERRRQVRALLLLAVAILLFSLFRAGIHTIFTPGWWRLW